MGIASSDENKIIGKTGFERGNQNSVIDHVKIELVTLFDY
jgi:hypothetical protein